MKLIESKAEYIPQEEGLEGMYKQVELAGRTAYHSLDKITPDSAKAFVDRMIKSKHGAALEHGTVYLMVHTIAPEDWDKKIGRHRRLTVDDCRDDLRTNPTCDDSGEENWWAKEAGHKAHVMAVKYADNPYSKVKIVLTKHELNTKDGVILTPTGGMPVIEKGTGKVISIFNTILVTTNLRVLVENNWLDDLQYLCSPTEFHEKRYTMRFTCDRGVSHQLVRERLMSFLQESQRYCSYIKEKFGASVTFIQPDWIKTSDQKEFEEDIKAVEKLYFKWLNKGYKAEEARYFLINGTKTEIVITAFASDWRHMLDLRYFEKTGKVSPDMADLMQKAQEVMQGAGIWEDIMSKPSKFE